MVKSFFLCRRLAELTREEYARRILEGHVPLALRHHPSMRRYVVNIIEHTPVPGPEYDSVAALYFDTLADYRERLYDSPEGQEIIGRDVAGFLAGADAYATSEYVHKDELGATPLGERTPAIKWICPLQRRAGMSLDEFAEHWRAEHVPLVLEMLEERQQALRYVTNVVDAKLSESGEDWDGFAEFWFAREEDARSMLDDTSEVMRKLGPSRERFISRAPLYVVAEYVQK